MMKLILNLTLFFFICTFSFAQSITQQYSNGDIPTSLGSFDPNCNGPFTYLAINLPPGESIEVTGIDIAYNFQSLGGSNPTLQRSAVYFQNKGIGESTISGTNPTTNSVEKYSRPGLSLANGAYPGGTTLYFEMHAWRTTGGSGCNSANQYIVNNTWSITVHYTINTIAKIAVNHTMPLATFDVNGKIKIGDDAAAAEAGNIRWNKEAKDLEGYDGDYWYSLTGKNTLEVNTIGQQSGMIPEYNMVESTKALIDSSAIIYDSGGEFGDYVANESKVWDVRIPASMIDKVLGIYVHIDSLNLPDVGDILQIGDMPGISNIAMGNMGMLITNLVPDGANYKMSIEFNSDSDATVGWGFKLSYQIIYGTKLAIDPANNPISNWKFNPSKNAVYGGVQFGNKWEEDQLGKNSIQFGLNTEASGDNAVAFGNGKALGKGAIALGMKYNASYNGEAKGDYSVTMGRASAIGEGSIAMGKSIASALNSMAFGESTASANYAFAAGKSTATGIGSIALGAFFNGTFNASATGAYASSFGRSAASGYNTLATGQSTATGNNASALGFSNASGDNATAGGDSEATMRGSTAFGSGSISSNDYATALGRSNASGINATAAGQSAANGNHAIATGFSNASGDYSSALGNSNTSGNYATAGGDSDASGNYSTAGGQSNATGFWSTAFGKSIASGYYSFAIGDNASATNTSSIAIGENTSATGYGSVAIGNNARCLVEYSVAIGRNAYTGVNRFGSVTISDAYTGWPIESNQSQSASNNHFAARFVNGYRFSTGVSGGQYIGAVLVSGATSWSSTCDVNRKENFETINGANVLNKFENIEFTTWNYKGQDPTTFRHYGIMAQDFYQAFGQDSYGTIGSDTLVNPIDLLGVAYAALKELSLQIKELQFENETLKVAVRDHESKNIELIVDHENSNIELTKRIATLESNMELLLSEIKKIE